MTDSNVTTDSAMRRGSALFARGALLAILTLFVAGLVAISVGALSVSTPLLATGCLLLVLVPIVNVLSELVDEIERRDWLFVAAAAVVLALIAYAAASRL